MAFKLPGHAAQFGGWVPPPRADPADEAESAAALGPGDEGVAAALALALGEEPSKRRAESESPDHSSRKRHKKDKKSKKHKKEKKKKKKHKKKRKKHSSDSDDSASSDDSDSDDAATGAAGAASAAHSSLAPDDWFAARLAKGYAKAERAEQKKKKAKEAYMRSGTDINALRAEFGGGDLGSVRAPDNMCRGGLEG